MGLMFYFVGTPIGNIKDTTYRAVEVLTTVDIILCEDTRAFNFFYQKIQRLFSLYPKKQQKIISYYKENEFERLPLILSYLKENKNIALVSESGMPTISDPGLNLINQLIKFNLPFTVIPGPTAFVTATVLSGFPSRNLLFLGFLPKKSSYLFQLFNRLKQIREILKEMTVVFYESPQRINKTLILINRLIPEVNLCLCREMTKKFEEVIRGKATELINKKIKGEITVVMEIK